MSQYNDFIIALKTTDEWNPRGTRQEILMSFTSTGFSQEIYAMTLKDNPVYKHRTFMSRFTVLFNSNTPGGNLVYVTDYKDLIRDGDTFPSVRVLGTTYDNYKIKDYLYWYAYEVTSTVNFNVWVYARKS